MITRLGSLGVWVGDGDGTGSDGVGSAGAELGDGVAVAWLGDGPVDGVVTPGGATGGGAQPIRRRPTAAPTSTFLMAPESSGRVRGWGLTVWLGWCSVPQVAPLGVALQDNFIVWDLLGRVDWRE